MLKMNNHKVLCLFIFLIYIKGEVNLEIAVRKFNHQKDMSEYCRRRVAPSVFLGKQVMEASSQIMHFSQLEVPYSCTMSVRTESGNNIILVVQLPSEMGLVDACAHNSDQLIVYEFGETFGGYWGHLSDTMIKKTIKNYTRFYTLKTTKPTTTTRRTIHHNTEESSRMLLHTVIEPTERARDFIRMEVPLVNVSGNFQLGPSLLADNAEEMFNFIYNVTPKIGVEYETRVLPVVQFSIKKQKEQGSQNSKRRYDLDYAVDGFTFDPRLLFSTVHKKVTKKRKGPMSTRLKFRNRNLHKFITPRSKSYEYFVKSRSFTKSAWSPSSSHWNNERPTKSLATMTSRSTAEITMQENLVKLFTLDYNLSDARIFKGKKINDTEFAYDGRSTLQTYFHVNDFKKKSTLALNKEKEQSTKIQVHSWNKVLHETIAVEVNDAAVVHDKSNKIRSNKEKTENYTLERGTMVDHESWENIVQAAPVMAVHLNQSEILSNKSTQTPQLSKFERSSKKKRHIHALQIEGSRPRNLTTQRAMTTKTEANQFSDVQDVAGLVELQDDEIAGRLALRYLRNYVGTVLFNICDFNEAKSRQVFLFNASRIVLAVNNFTLEGMTLVLTPAQSLVDSTSVCETGYLECQIIGSRVCIDSMNSCDSIPNCGSYDIYDEDRLKCGVAKGLQHNVYLAAFTFLALILTMLYTVHYWFKRCVPNVSEAFFIYTDASENTLFLDSIMRSPKETDEASYKFAYPSHFFENQEEFQDDLNENVCRRVIKRCIALMLCKKREKQSIDYVTEVYSTPIDHLNKFSFTEYELRKLTMMTSKEAAVQTGESLEMQANNYGFGKKAKIPQNSLQNSLNKKENVDQQDHDKFTEELKLIKFSKESRSSYDAMTNEKNHLGRMSRRLALVVEDETEIKSTVYVRESDSNIVPENIQVKCEVHPEKPKKNVEAEKLLRFNEELTMIPSMESGGEITISTLGSKRSVVIGTGGNQDLDTITQVEPEASEGRDFMRFWGSKSKKGKRKKEKHLPRFN